MLAEGMIKCGRCLVSDIKIFQYVITNQGLMCEVCFDYGKSLSFSCCGGAGAATWNQTNGTWNCSDCGSVKSNDSSYIGGSHTPDTNDMWYGKPKKVCECGADKVYGLNSGMHSATMPCPLYVKP